MAKTNKRRAIDFFYPRAEGRHWWGGYDRFFSPALPSRIGDLLVGYIYEALRGSVEARDRAIGILSQSHRKNRHVKGQSITQVMCHPTTDARAAIDLLSAL